MRDNILRAQSNSNTTAITGFDSLVSQLQIFAKQINNKNVEISRLTELCKKNKIEYAVKELKPTVVAAPKNK